MPAERAARGPAAPLPSRGIPTGWLRWAYLPLLVSLFAGIFILYLIDSGAGSDPRTGGVLLPALVRASGAVLPAAVLDGLGRLAPAGGTGAPELPGIRIAADAPADTLLLYGWLGAFLLAFTLAAEPLFRAATGLGSGWTRLVPFAALAGLPLFIVGSVPSDLPALALTTLGLLFMAHRRWALYSIALAAAALNSVAAALLPVAFALYYSREGRVERRRFLALLLGQVVAVLLILGGSAALAGGPGAEPGWSPPGLHLQAYRMETAVAWIAVLLAFAFDWNRKPALLKAAAAAALPLAAATAALGIPPGMHPAFALYPAVLCLVLFPFIARAEQGGPSAMRPEPAGMEEPS